NLRRRESDGHERHGRGWADPVELLRWLPPAHSPGRTQWAAQGARTALSVASGKWRRRIRDREPECGADLAPSRRRKRRDVPGRRSLAADLAAGESAGLASLGRNAVAHWYGVGHARVPGRDAR